MSVSVCKHCRLVVFATGLWTNLSLSLCVCVCVVLTFILLPNNPSFYRQITSQEKGTCTTLRNTCLRVSSILVFVNILTKAYVPWSFIVSVLSRSQCVVFNHCTTLPMHCTCTLCIWYHHTVHIIISSLSMRH